MGLKSKVVGGDRLRARVQRIGAAATKEVGKAVAVSAVLVQGECRRRIQRGARSGRIYRRGNITHQASAPGEYPKTDTGRLVASIFAEVDDDSLGAVVGTDVIYGKYLESGTRRMSARPWLQPTFDDLKPRITKLVNAAMRRGMRAGARGR